MSQNDRLVSFSSTDTASPLDEIRNSIQVTCLHPFAVHIKLFSFVKLATDFDYDVLVDASPVELTTGGDGYTRFLSI